MRVQVSSYTCLNNIRHQLNIKTSYIFMLELERILGKNEVVSLILTKDFELSGISR